MCRTNPGVACRTSAGGILCRASPDGGHGPRPRPVRTFLLLQAVLPTFPGRLGHETRLAHTKGSRPVRIIQGQDPVEDVRSYTVVPPTVVAVKFASTQAWISEPEPVDPPGPPPPGPPKPPAPPVMK